jgi:hypothetical protein
VARPPPLLSATVSRPPAGGAFIEPPLSPGLSPPASAFGTVISDSVCHGSDQPPNSLKGGGFRPFRDSVADAVEQREQGRMLLAAAKASCSQAVGR